MPQKLKNLIDANKWVETDQSGIMDCMECGCCSYICPAKLSLVQTFKLGKKIVAGIRKREADEAKARKEGGK
jgi:electron transport complex protein RnfC